MYFNIDRWWKEDYTISDFSENELFNPSETIQEIDNDDISPSTRIKKAVYPGDYQTKAFFSYDSTTGVLDANGSGYEWTEYDDIPGYDGWNLVQSRFGVGDITYAVVPSVNDTYYLTGADYWASGRYGMMYSPELTYNTTINDTVHYIFNMHRDLNDNATDSRFNNMDATFRITLWHYHTSTQASTEITSVEYLMPKINTPTDTEYWEWMQTSSSFSSYTVPAGDRFRVTYEMKYNDVGATLGHFTLNIMQDGRYSDSGILGTDLDWDIDDGIHSNNYTVYNVDGMLGVQLYMYEHSTPDIDFYDATNGTVYTAAQNVTIDVTDGSNSDYRWDEGSWIPFSNDVITELPTTHGWHTLDVRASDPDFNNTRTEQLIIGYDASTTNVELHLPYYNGSDIVGGDMLNFTLYYVDSATYEWDQNTTQIALTDPYDIITPIYEGEHNLTIVTNDFHSTETVFYIFQFDADVPYIKLDGAAIIVDINQLTSTMRRALLDAPAMKSIAIR